MLAHFCCEYLYLFLTFKKQSKKKVRNAHFLLCKTYIGCGFQEPMLRNILARSYLCSKDFQYNSINLFILRLTGFSSLFYSVV